MLILFLFLGFLNLNSGYTSNYIDNPSPVVTLDANIKRNIISQKEFSNLIEIKDLKAKSVLVKELNGRFILGINYNEKKPIASITKLLSSYLVLSLTKNNFKLTFDNEAISQPGNVGFFKAGEKITRDQALKASLISSSNDSIYLLAKNFGYGKFVELMNKQAKSWNLSDTSFVDPMGISKDNVSSAKDLITLIEKIYSLKPEIFYLTTLEKVVINNKILWTTNLLLPKYHNYIVGAKTGFTDEAGECLVMIVKLDKSPFIGIVILDSNNRWSDAEKIIFALEKFYNGN